MKTSFAPRFVVASDGVVRDTRTDLEWTGTDGGRNLLWSDAGEYCRSLVLGAPGPWRLPEIAELADLYDEAQHQPCDASRECRLDPAIDLTGPYVWSSTDRGPDVRLYLDFQFGTKFAPMLTPGLKRRVLCVRSAATRAAD